MSDNGWKDEKDNTVTVYDRYHFAVPVRGIIRETNHNSYKVDFFSNNSGGKNVNKHDGKWFLKGQCHVDKLNHTPDVNEIWNLPEDLLAMDLAIHSMAELIANYQLKESQESDLNTRKISINEIIEKVMDKARDELEKQKS